jgi:hypothetical protein
MQKVLLGQEEVFIHKRQGKPHLWDFSIEEILDAANNDLENASVLWKPASDVLPLLRQWIKRYFDGGLTDNFLDDLNSKMEGISYSKMVLPLDLLPTESGYPRAGYLANLDDRFSETEYAAMEFSKILTSGMLRRVKQCQMEGCEKLFVGRPQAKWCSKTCGSKHRVRKKRRRDSE